MVIRDSSVPKMARGHCYVTLRGSFRLACVPPREVGTITYRSGPEWAMRFGHKRAHPDSPPDFCPDFEIERYLEYQVGSARSDVPTAACNEG